ncbi:hypothetical protein [Citrobacter portucalensis]|nr:hypothetical protein [Citrobacter portucalensis]
MPDGYGLMAKVNGEAHSDRSGHVALTATAQPPLLSEIKKIA